MKKYVIGITGGSGAGKTTVSDEFRKRGIEIIDADKVARLIMEPNQPCLKETAEAFGADILNEDGSLQRKKLAKIVFSDPKSLDILNRITHKYITEYFLEKIKNSDADIIGIDGAVLFESDINRCCDFMIGVVAEEKERVKRIVKRDNISEEEAVMRINSQKKNEFYIENCDYLVYNDNDRTKISEAVEEVLGKLGEKEKNHI